MDWQLFFSTFGVIFLAEMGDKTQLATMARAAGSQSRGVVFLAAALALIATSAVAVLAGEAVSRVLPPIWLHRVAGVAFLILGILYLWRAGEQGG